ncbi:redox-sensing transcriptional repressor Rex [Lentisphaerota bacterium ZTH]|nr:redox-sensing transcriptional repressor Rex [Lentisphaerota bacterium]WET07454.1 redox-sensing transcriptional repressor Rex [Lentisphaerota bacterium ZTH]
MGNKKVQKLPSIRRMPTYLHKLKQMRKNGLDTVSTTIMARYMNLEPIVIRKDLELTGVTGQPGVGYKIDELIDAIKSFLNWHNTAEAVLIGAGSLGRALLGYEGFEDYGLNIIAAFDADPSKIGAEINEREVFDINRLPEMTTRLQVNMGILCVPNEFAQEAADMMVEGGINAIWNFTNVSLDVPDHVVVQREVIASGLAVLSVKLNQQMLTD